MTGRREAFSLSALVPGDAPAPSLRLINTPDRCLTNGGLRGFGRGPTTSSLAAFGKSSDVFEQHKHGSPQTAVALTLLANLFFSSQG